MKATTLLMTVLLTAACSGSGTQARDPESEQKLVKALERWDQQKSAFDEQSRPHQKKCELLAGDCLLIANQKRDELIFSHSTDKCKQEPDSEREARCVADALVAQGHAKSAAEYYAFGNRCFDKMLACTSDLQEKAVEKQRLARTETRRAELFGSDEALSFRSTAELARESVTYLRATLPPKLDGVCSKLPEFAACEKSVEDQDSRVEAALGLDVAGFDRGEAMRLYAGARAQEASCYDPEFACLEASVARYGVTYQTQKLLQRNLDALETRVQLVLHVTQATSKHCLEAAQAEHSSGIINNYQVYAKQPVMFFRSRLHRAFLSMHRAQVECLKSAAGPALTARATRSLPKAKAKDCSGKASAC